MSNRFAVNVQLKYVNTDDPKSSPDTVGMNGMMNYLKDLNVSVEDIGMLIISELVGSTTLGEMNREAFIKGWSEHSYVRTVVCKVIYSLDFTAPPQSTLKGTQRKGYAKALLHQRLDLCLSVYIKIRFTLLELPVRSQ